jgi:hypothetical protein
MKWEPSSDSNFKLILFILLFLRCSPNPVWILAPLYGFVTVNLSGVGFLAPRQTLSLEHQGLHFVWPLLFDPLGMSSPTRSLRPASTVIRVTETRKPPLYGKMVVLEVNYKDKNVNKSKEKFTIMSWICYKKFWEQLITFFPLIWDGPHRKWCFQQFFYCCLCIRWGSNVFTEPMPNNDRGIHAQTHRLMEGIYELRYWDELRCHNMYSKFHKDWFIDS